MIWIKKQGHCWWATWWLLVLMTVVQNVAKHNSKGLWTREKTNLHVCRAEGDRTKKKTKNPSNPLILNYFRDRHDLMWEWFILNLNSQIKNQTPREPCLLLSLFCFLSACLIEACQKRISACQSPAHSLSFSPRYRLRLWPAIKQLHGGTGHTEICLLELLCHSLFSVLAFLPSQFS